jgi:uncharacterized glyoxalase superfamily protein PhnB
VTDAQVVSSEVEVAVDPATAFSAFTEEMDLWWVRGPINFYGNGGRVVEIRCEPGVGGRILEVYDRKDGDDTLERARITSWEPGVRVGWDSARDDVVTEVRFEPTAVGTRVVVEHRIPAGGVDRGGTAWSRVVPAWFGAWCAKRDRVPHEQIDIARLSLALNYSRPAAAARFLADAFGFESVDRLPEGEDPLPEGPHGPPWIEFRIGNAALMLFPLPEGEGPRGVTHVPWVYVEDLEAHYNHARKAGATILSDIHDFASSPVYEAADLEGNRWTFSQARPTQR